MPQHGDYDPQQLKWYCGYWMTPEEWLDVHDYAPPTSGDQIEHSDEEE